MTSRHHCGILPAMFWYVMLVLFSPLYLMFGLVFRDEQAPLALALYHQVLILQRQLGKRPSLAPVERLALVLSSLLLGRKKLRETLLVAKPETLDGLTPERRHSLVHPNNPIRGSWSLSFRCE